MNTIQKICTVLFFYCASATIGLMIGDVLKDYLETQEAVSLMVIFGFCGFCFVLCYIFTGITEHWN